MPLPQISLFLENKPGRLASVCHALTDGGVNIASLSLADTSDFGIVRLLVDKPDAARDLLKAAGFGVNVRDVVAIAAGDEPGTLAKVLDVIDTTGANVDAPATRPSSSSASTRRTRPRRRSSPPASACSTRRRCSPWIRAGSRGPAHRSDIAP